MEVPGAERVRELDGVRVPSTFARRLLSSSADMS